MDTEDALHEWLDRMQQKRLLPVWCRGVTKSRFGRTIRCDFFLRFRWKKTPPPIRPLKCFRC